MREGVEEILILLIGGVRIRGMMIGGMKGGEMIEAAMEGMIEGTVEGMTEGMTEGTTEGTKGQNMAGIAEVITGGMKEICTGAEMSGPEVVKEGDPVIIILRVIPGVNASVQDGHPGDKSALL